MKKYIYSKGFHDDYAEHSLAIKMITGSKL